MARAPRSKKTRAPRGRGKKGKLSVDFEGVESGGGRAVSDGSYRAILNKAEEAEGQDSGETYIAMRWKMVEGLSKGTKKSEGGIVFDNCSLQPQSLWRLRTILECLGEEVPDGPMDIDLESLIDSECTVEVTNEEWEGKDRPRITGFSSVSVDDEENGEDEDEEEEEEAPKKTRSRKRKGKKEDEEEEDEEEADEEEEEEAPKKKRGKKEKAPAKGKGKKLRIGSKVIFQDEEGDDVKGVITALDDESATVEDSDGDDWEVEVSELTAA